MYVFWNTVTMVLYYFDKTLLIYSTNLDKLFELLTADKCWSEEVKDLEIGKKIKKTVII